MMDFTVYIKIKATRDLKQGNKLIKLKRAQILKYIHGILVYHQSLIEITEMKIM